jgi:putative inorganic carbon (hco3(-)) transporter
MENVFNKITKYSIYSLVFLLPLFFLPFSFEAFEFNKQYLLFFFVSIGFLAWLVKMILVDKEIRIKRSPLDFFVLLFFSVALLSFAFSTNKMSGWLGFYGRFSDGLINLLSLTLFYFLITNNVASRNELDKKQIKISKLINFLFISTGLIVFFSYISVFNLWQKIAGLPYVMSQVIFNPVSGSLEGLAVFLAVVIIALLSLFSLNQQKNKKLSQIGFYVLFSAILGLLIIINFNPAWLIILLSSVLFLLISLSKQTLKQGFNKTLLFVLLIFFAGLFIFLPSSKLQQAVLNYQLPQEQILSQKVSWSIGLNQATENFKTGLIGSGVGTFHYSYAKFKPIEMNQANIWQIRFDRSGNHFSEILATMGFLGLISYLILIIAFLFIGSFFLAKGQTNIGFLIVLISLLIGQFFFYQNTVLGFSFHLFLALAAINWQKPLKEKNISFKQSPEKFLIFSVILIVIGLIFLSIYFFAFKFYLADVNYKNYLETQSEENLIKASTLNPYQSQYKIALAKNYLNKIINEGQKPTEQVDQNALSNYVYLAINSAKQATEASPARVTAWETLAIIYREIQGIAAGAREWGINSFEKAIILEPLNPALQTELGKLYFFAGQPDKAKDQFNKAKQVMPEYADASIQLALLYEIEDDINQAIKQMEELVSFYPHNIEVIFQLGRFYLNNNQLDQSIEQLEWAVQLFPNHSNSLYVLAVAHQRKDNKERAIELFEKVLEINPTNENVIEKLAELEQEETIIEQEEQEETD